MADDITNIVLLNHMQVMKGELQEQIANLDNKIAGMESDLSRLDAGLTGLTAEMRRGFEDARLHRQALQEDLEATIRMVGKHDRKLARL